MTVYVKAFADCSNSAKTVQAFSSYGTGLVWVCSNFKRDLYNFNYAHTHTFM